MVRAESNLAFCFKLCKNAINDNLMSGKRNGQKLRDNKLLNKNPVERCWMLVTFCGRLVSMQIFISSTKKYLGNI